MSSLEISYSFSLPISSVTLELRRLDLNKLPPLEPKPPVIRYGHNNLGGMIHLDIKKLGMIDGVGHGITGDRSTLCRKPGRKAGWEYLHGCVHDNSRASYSELLPDEKATSATCFMIRAVGWFEGRGIKQDRVLTHNGGCYRSHLFNAACQYLGVRPKKTRPYTPRTNGKAGRFIQRSLKEWVYKQAYESSAEREKHLQPRLGQRSLKEWAYCQAYGSSAVREEHFQPWLGRYKRRKEAAHPLNMKPPVSRLLKCEQRPC